MKATEEQVQRIADEIDFTDGSHAREEIRRALEPILDDVVGEVLRQVRGSFPTTGSAVWQVARDLGVEL